MTEDNDSYEIDEGTKFAVQVMGAMHSGTTAALEGVIRNFCIEARTRQALIALTHEKILDLTNSDTLYHPYKYAEALVHRTHEVEEWLQAHYDGDWRDYTTHFNRAGF